MRFLKRGQHSSLCAWRTDAFDVILKRQAVSIRLTYTKFLGGNPDSTVWCRVVEEVVVLFRLTLPGGSIQIFCRRPWRLDSLQPFLCIFEKDYHKNQSEEQRRKGQCGKRRKNRSQAKPSQACQPRSRKKKHRKRRGNKELLSSTVRCCCRTLGLEAWLWRHQGRTGLVRTGVFLAETISKRLKYCWNPLNHERSRGMRSPQNWG